VGVAIAFGTLTSFYNDQMKAIGATERVFELIDMQPAISISGGKQLDSIDGCVEYKDVEPQTPFPKPYNLTAARFASPTPAVPHPRCCGA
jgi:hypothetical protein